MTADKNIVVRNAFKVFSALVFKGLFSFFLIYSFMFSFCVKGYSISLRDVSGDRSTTILSALSLDKSQTVKIKAGIITEAGAYGIAEIDGWAAGHTDNSINGMMSLWLSFGQPGTEAGTYEELALPGWNIMLALRPGQSPEQTAKAIAEYINADNERPYYAVAHCHKVLIYYRTAYEAKGEQDIKDDCEKSALDMPHKAKIIPASAAKNKNAAAKTDNKTSRKQYYANNNGLQKKQDYSQKRICVIPL